jgi:hypothetical protein
MTLTRPPWVSLSDSLHRHSLIRLEAVYRGLHGCSFDTHPKREENLMSRIGRTCSAIVAKAGMPRVAKSLDKIDTAKQGYITLEQLQAFAAKQ